MERSAGDAVLIHFRCTNPAHLGGAETPSDTVTMHDGLWAYCPFDVRAAAHQWTATGGVPLQALRRGSAPP